MLVRFFTLRKGMQQSKFILEAYSYNHPLRIVGFILLCRKHYHSPELKYKLTFLVIHSMDNPLHMKCLKQMMQAEWSTCTTVQAHHSEPSKSAYVQGYIFMTEFKRWNHMENELNCMHIKVVHVMVKTITGWQWKIPFSCLWQVWYCNFVSV